METTHTCSHCRRDLDVGLDAIEVNAGVVGMKGFVPLGEKLLFCCEECIRDYYDLGDLAKVGPRIP